MGRFLYLFPQQNVSSTLSVAEHLKVSKNMDNLGLRGSDCLVGKEKNLTKAITKIDVKIPIVIWVSCFGHVRPRGLTEGTDGQVDIKG